MSVREMVKAGRGEWGKGLAGEAISYRISHITLCPLCPLCFELSAMSFTLKRSAPFALCPPPYACPARPVEPGTLRVFNRGEIHISDSLPS